MLKEPEIGLLTTRKAAISRGFEKRPIRARWRNCLNGLARGEMTGVSDGLLPVGIILLEIAAVPLPHFSSDAAASRQ